VSEYDSLIPPAGGETYMGVYTLANPIVAWLIGLAPEIVAEPAERLRRGGDTPPRCPIEECGARMHYRPGAWRCYQHDETVTVAVRPHYAPAPRGDVLSRASEMLDYVYSDEEGWHIEAIEAAR